MPTDYTFCTGTEAAVCNDIAARQAKGVAKYGTTVRDNPLTLRQWAQHSYEECLDMAVYLRRMMEEMDTVAARADEAREKAKKFAEEQRANLRARALSITKGPEPGSDEDFPQEKVAEKISPSSSPEKFSQEKPACAEDEFKGCNECSLFNRGPNRCEYFGVAISKTNTGFRIARHTETGRLLEISNRLPLPAGYHWADDPAPKKAKPEPKPSVAAWDAINAAALARQGKAGSSSTDTPKQ